MSKKHRRSTGAFPANGCKQSEVWPGTRLKEPTNLSSGGGSNHNNDEIASAPSRRGKKSPGKVVKRKSRSLKHLNRFLSGNLQSE